MKGVAIEAWKGGVGKTTLCHLAALGACFKGTPTHFIHTDDRKPIRVRKRPYQFYDCRKPEVLQAVVESAVNEDGLFIVDSGGNRPEFDAWIAEAMDLVLIPTTPDPEDVVMAIEQLIQLEKLGAKNAKLVINRYPTHPKEQASVAKWLKELPESKILCKVRNVQAVKCLRASDPDEGFQTPVSKVNNLAREFFVRVNHHLDGGNSDVHYLPVSKVA